MKKAVVLLSGGRGTANMIQLAEDAGLPVWQPALDGEDGLPTPQGLVAR